MSSSGLRLVDMEMHSPWRESWLISNKPVKKTPNTAGVLVIVDVDRLSSGLCKYTQQLDYKCVWGGGGLVETVDSVKGGHLDTLY